MTRTSELLQTLNLTDEELTERTGLPFERVTSILRGEPVSLSEIRQLSAKLRIPISRFSGNKASWDNNLDIQLLFRRVGALDLKLDPTREFVAQFVVAAAHVLPQRSQLPNWIQEIETVEESYAGAELLANRVRSIICPDNLYEPIPHLAPLLGERTDVIIGTLERSRFEGASLLYADYPFIFVSPRFAGRMLFTLAHELGHIVAHHTSDDNAIFERASEIGGWRQRRREAFVDAFASILLMPSQGVGRGLKKIREHFNIKSGSIGDLEILMLARYFGVSFEVAARRCEALELLPLGGARSLCDRLKEEFGSPEKRASSANLPPRVEVSIPHVSANLMAAIVGSISENRISIGWATDKFHLSVDEIFTARKKLGSEYPS